MRPAQYLLASAKAAPPGIEYFRFREGGNEPAINAWWRYPFSHHVLAQTSTYQHWRIVAPRSGSMVRTGAPPLLSDIPEHELIRQVRNRSNAACELLFCRYERP